MPLAEIGLQRGDLVRAEGVDPWQGSFQALNGHPLLREVQIVHVQEAHFERPQSVPIGVRKSARSRFRVMTRKKARSSGWVRNWMVVAFHVFGMGHVVTPVER